MIERMTRIARGGTKEGGENPHHDRGRGSEQFREVNGRTLDDITREGVTESGKAPLQRHDRREVAQGGWRHEGSTARAAPVVEGGAHGGGGTFTNPPERRQREW